MALRFLLMTMMFTSALGVDHIVGDNKGWNTGIAYTAWVDARNFHVGDSITFMYTPQEHNVIKVNGSEFQCCIYSSAAENELSSGFDVVPLTSLGKQLYISDMYKDCSEGMKLALTVTSPADGPAPVPVSGSSASSPSASAATEVSPAMKYYLWLISIVVVHSTCKHCLISL